MSAREKPPPMPLPRAIEPPVRRRAVTPSRLTTWESFAWGIGCTVGALLAAYVGLRVALVVALVTLLATFFRAAWEASR